MDISLQLGISYFLLLLVFIVVGHGEGQDECSKLRCGPHGPPVRFPFVLKNRQQDHCGFPGFNLSCTDTNDTLLELPVSVKLFVKKIDYKSQVIHLYYPGDCFPRELQRFNLSSSPFQFNQYRRYGYGYYSSPSHFKQYRPYGCGYHSSPFQFNQYRPYGYGYYSSPSRFIPNRPYGYGYYSSPSHFNPYDYKNPDYRYRYSLFNCSQAEGKDNSRSHWISCLSGSGNQVYAIDTC
jgi:hypothetical protein